MPRIFIASDHAGFQFKNELMRARPDLDWKDLGPFDEERTDYPDWADVVTKEVLADKGTDKGIGILICGSGQGMVMRANRHKGIRAALCWDNVTARLCREHNNANVLCLGGRLIPLGLAQQILETFLKTSFCGGRHEDRVKKIDQ